MRGRRLLRRGHLPRNLEWVITQDFSCPPRHTCKETIAVHEMWNVVRAKKKFFYGKK